MLRGLFQLAWLETKIFLREPMGAFGTLVVPVLAFIAAGSVGRSVAPTRFPGSDFERVGLPVFVALLMAVSAVLSLVTIIAIYREGGILKRLRATPLRPQTILAAHVLVKIGLTATTFALLVLAGKRYVVTIDGAPLASFAAALLVTTASVLAVGFLIASLVPTARFAQPMGAVILYPMIVISGLFFPVEALPPLVQAVAHVLPFTYAVSLLQGIWVGEPWSAHLGDVAALAVTAAACTALSSRVFRWE